jgi:hypothetical protein
MLDGLPALGEKREAALGQAARGAEERIPGAGINVQFLHSGGLS